MNVSRIWKRNFIYFLTSFMWSATLSVVPQTYFMTNYPEYKNILLSTFLFVGTVASIIGILISQHKRFMVCLNDIKEKKFLLICSCIFIITLTFCLLLVVKTLLAYFILFIIMKFISNMFYNCIDRMFISEYSTNLLKTHVRSNLSYQLLGMMFAPLYFSFFLENKVQNIIFISCISLVASIYIYHSQSNLAVEVNSISLKVSEEEKLGIYNILFIAYSFIVLCATTMLISIIIFILKEHYGFVDPSKKGGIMIGIISVFAVISLILNNALVNDFLSFTQNCISTSLFIVSIFAFYCKVSQQYIYIAIMSIFPGIAYGIFLSNTRAYASRPCKNSSNLISIYNNLPNYAALLGFLVIFLVSFATKTLYLNFCGVMLKIIIMFFLIALSVLFIMEKIRRDVF